LELGVYFTSGFDIFDGQMMKTSIPRPNQRVACGHRVATSPHAKWLPRNLEFREKCTVNFGERVPQIPIVCDFALAIQKGLPLFLRAENFMVLVQAPERCFEVVLPNIKHVAIRVKQANVAPPQWLQFFPRREAHSLSFSARRFAACSRPRASFAK
jgi:hypothetical protein